MYQLKFRSKAYRSIAFFAQTAPKELAPLDSAFVELQEFWAMSAQVKNIGRVKGTAIYRKRVWRWRIVFSQENSELEIFIIEIEKSTTKDYARWLAYIRRGLT